MFLPELNLGFEFNGLHWHSEFFIDKNQHLEKTKLCEKNNIHLIHIFEDDFDIVTNDLHDKINEALNMIDIDIDFLFLGIEGYSVGEKYKNNLSL